MTQEDKILLAKDLFCRALSGIKVNYRGNVYTLGYNMYLKDGNIAFESYPMMYFLEGVEEVKPYLRPMSSMTEEEKKVICSMNMISDMELNDRLNYQRMYVQNYTIETFDYFNEHKLDYRGLIPMGLALEATEGMYK